MQTYPMNTLGVIDSLLSVGHPNYLADRQPALRVAEAALREERAVNGETPQARLLARMIEALTSGGLSSELKKEACDMMRGVAGAMAVGPQAIPEPEVRSFPDGEIMPQCRGCGQNYRKKEFPFGISAGCEACLLAKEIDDGRP